MTVVFDGKNRANKEEEILIKRTHELKDSFGVTPRLATILVGDNPASRRYVELKKQAAKRVGCKLDIYYFDENTEVDTLINQIEGLNQNPKIHGIMLQLPLPDTLRPDTDEIIEAIDPQKDVDGLRFDSPFVHPTSQAILDILENSLIINNQSLVILIGSAGFVGSRTLKLLKEHKFNVKGVDIEVADLKNETSKADVIISTTGVPNLVTSDMVKSGVSIIDIGYPKGDTDAGVYKKAKFITPIIGGVGPVTIICLLENLTSAAYNSLIKHTHQSS